MNWYRSWPARVPSGRACVIDSLPRLVMTGYDYQTVDGGLPRDDPGFCMLEWDVALDRVGRDLFATHALEQPDRVLVAPYLIYPVAHDPIVVHKHAPDPTRVGHRHPIAEGQTEAHSFGLGCIYLPQTVLTAWREGGRRPLRDTTFSDWHIDRYGTVAVDWSIRPQHLHGD